MKNFRKVLALIVVVATLFSFASMASAKELADYSDAEKVSYDEAVDVLSAIGILNGYTDGSFKPTNNIRRDEMAKMVAVLSNAGDDVSELYASACKFADAKNNWAASYIAYDTQVGILAGRSATTFDPTANVTGLETAKMLLCVLGFDASEQGYVGANWAVNVLRDAKNFGLLDGFAQGYEVDKAITREEAAQMFLNALQSPLIVGTVSGNIVKISSAIYAGRGYKDVTLIDAEKFGWVKLYGNVVIGKDTLASVYKGLDLNQYYEDCYENPGHMWTYSDIKGNVIYSGAYLDAPTATFNSAVDLYAQVKSTVENAAGKPYMLYASVDGFSRSEGTTGAAAIKTVLDAVSATTGAGVETRLYVDDVNGVIDVTVKHTLIGSVSSVSLKNNSFTIDGILTFSNTGYNFKGDETILYWLCDNNDPDIDDVDIDDATATSRMTLHGAEVVAPTVAQVTRTETPGTFVADGKTYGFAFTFGTTIAYGLNGGNAALPAIGVTYDIYTDKDGNVMWYAEHVDATEYVYAYAVEDTWTVKLPTTITSSGSDTKYLADLVTFDGNTSAQAEVDETTAAVMKSYKDDYAADGSISPAGALMRFVKSGDKLVLDGRNADGTVVAGTDGGVAKKAGAQSQLQAGTGDVVKADGRVIVTTNDYTKFLVRTYSYDTGAYSYNAFEGFRNIPTTYLNAIFDNGQRHQSLQYFDTDNNGIAEYVFVDAAYAASADLFYVLGYTKTVKDLKYFGKVQDWDVYSALVNGESTEVFVAHVENGVAPALTATTLYQGKLVSLENIDGQKAYILMSAEAPVMVQYQEVTVSGSKIQIGKGNEWKVLAADAKVYLVTVTAAGAYDSHKTLENVESLGAYCDGSDWMVEGYATYAGGEIAELYVEVTPTTDNAIGH